MTFQTRIRWHVEAAPRSGTWNMALDEALLEAVADSSASPGGFVRMYEWDTATVSLGYFQRMDDFRRSEPLAHLPAVRRLSGGGAILHHHELTYSVALPATHPVARDPVRLYRLLHEVIIHRLAECGFETALRGEDLRSPTEAFLCFIRGDRHDILCRGRKVVGSAQRRRRGAVLQHGSLILKASPFAPDIPGLLDLMPGALPAGFAESLGQSLAAACGPAESIPQWPDDILAAACRLEEQPQVRSAIS